VVLDTGGSPGLAECWVVSEDASKQKHCIEISLELTCFGSFRSSSFSGVPNSAGAPAPLGTRNDVGVEVINMSDKRRPRFQDGGTVRIRANEILFFVADHVDRRTVCRQRLRHRVSFVFVVAHGLLRIRCKFALVAGKHG
jgi:hypothetical protein